MKEHHEIVTVQGDQGYCVEHDQWEDLDDVRRDEFDLNDDDREAYDAGVEDFVRLDDEWESEENPSPKDD